jgi:hypothetical protein
MDVPDFDVSSKDAFIDALQSPTVRFNEKSSPIAVHVGTKIVKHLKLNKTITRNKIQ